MSRLPAAALLLLLGGLAGCGYHAGLVVPERSTTIGIEVLGNASPLRNLEAEVTAELARAVTDLVPLTLVPPDRADVVITGIVADYRRRSGVRDSDNVPLETAVSVVVSANLVRRTTGEVLETASAALATGFVVENGLIADDVPDEEAARRRALANLADRLVLDLFSPLSYSE